MTSMDPVRWLVASAELDRVLELFADERARYLASLRARDSLLAADVESLLDEHRALDAEGFLREVPAGLSTGPSDTTRTSEAESSDEMPGSTEAGSTRLGPYRIVRTLGRGGMGTVYEADEIDSGRRVALKVLKERLNDPRERERFHREGRLAASLNHPHCVFVFAASEVDGRLAIAMELMQGTLADRLKAQGTLPPAEAVDATLQLVSGLRAAAALGILHRDVKPSNCFVGADGAIKIGDFGISRSLRPTEETAFSTRTKFAATPAYASPEQLRGVALDTRADIYSLGATLYELLTGRPPFEREDLMALLMAAANDVPQPPHALVPAVPKGLSRVVLRCLAKQPHQRFADYDALAAALEPYSSTAARPATLGRRFFAGTIDLCVLGLCTAVLSIWWMGPVTPMERGVLLRQQLPWFLALLAYFGIAESVCAATPGKALVGLTLVDSNGRPPTPSRAVARAALFATVWTLGGLVWVAVWAGSGNDTVISTTPWSAFFTSVMPWVLPAAVFSTARRRNGYAGWHDLATRTRIVERRMLAATLGSPVPAGPLPATQVVAQLGPFHVIEGAIAGMPAGWRPGFDERLRRHVWIRAVPPGTPPLDAERLAVSRPTRLRWLAGRRESDKAWDVFEAVPGVPLEQACAQPRSWADPRWWLLDLARECAAQASEDGPPLRADRVWILDTGGAKLVDDPLVDRVDRAPRASLSAPALLLSVFHAARGRSAHPWPLGAHRFVDQLSTDPPPSTSTIVSVLESLTRQRAVITRGWRALQLAAVATLPLLMSAGWIFVGSYSAMQIERLPRDVLIALDALSHLESADRGLFSLSPPDREAIELALATHYRDVLKDRRMFGPEFFYQGIRFRNTVDRVLRRQPTEAEGRRTSEQPVVRAMVKDAGNARFDPPPIPALTIDFLAVFFAIVACLSLFAALAFRGGLMRIIGLEIVRADGRTASRLRVLARVAIAWAPLIVIVPLAIPRLGLGAKIAGPAGILTITALALLILLAGAIVAVLHPSRGIQDRLAGTWIVPR